MPQAHPPLHPTASTVSTASTANPSAWIEHALQAYPSRTFLTTPDGSKISYAQMVAQSGRFASALVQLGVQPGDRVAVQVEKSANALMLYLACLRLGAVFLPLNTGYTLAELEYFFTDAKPQLVLARPQDLPQLTALQQRLQIPHLHSMDAQGEGSLSALAAGCADDAFTSFTGNEKGDELAALVYTSGTTGRSKGAMLTRANLASNAVALVEAWRFTADDVLLHALPIFHAHGLFIAANTVLACGASMLFLPKFDADEVLRLLPQATVLMGIPTFYTRLLLHPLLDRDSCAHMRLFVSGSAPLLADTHKEFAARTGHQILERYAMTETVVNTSNPYEGLRLPGAVGPALPGVQVRITDPASGALLPQAESIGMIEVRGPNVFSGYWQMPEKTKEELRADGFFITGDLGKFDQNGYLHIVGRGKDLIISGGYNVYPKDVEGELDALPGVEESAVIGLPHADFGEAVTAVLVAQKHASLDEAALLAALGTRLAKFKLPKRIIIVDELPRNTMGKVQKNLLRQQYADLYRAGKGTT